MAVLHVLKILTEVLGNFGSKSMAMAETLLRLSSVLTSDEGSKRSD